jgi:hypothetical protein
MNRGGIDPEQDAIPYGWRRDGGLWPLSTEGAVPTEEAVRSRG